MTTDNTKRVGKKVGRKAFNEFKIDLQLKKHVNLEIKNEKK